jgi:hypothetical protein
MYSSATFLSLEILPGKSLDFSNVETIYVAFYVEDTISAYAT